MTPEAALRALAAIPREDLDWALDLFQVRVRFRDFVTFAWSIIEPGRPLEPNWHIDVICDAIQKQAEGDPAYKRLLILIPPGDLKSVIVSVMRPAWIWLQWPHRRSLYFSHSADIAKRDSRRTRDILDHDYYRKLRSVCVQLGWDPPWEFKADQNEKHNFVNDLQGQRLCFGLDGKWTGERGDDIVIDDPVDAGTVVTSDDVTIAAMFEHANQILRNKMQSRVNDLEKATWTLMMQRLGVGDPADHALADGDWKVLCFPKEFDPDHPLYDPSIDPRTERGQYLSPRDVRLSAELKRLKRTMAPRHWNAQYGQRTSRSSEGLFNEQTFLDCPRYTTPPDRDAFSEIAMTVDCAVKKTATSDRASIQVWGRHGWGRRTLLARDTRRMSFPELKAAMVTMSKTWGPAFTLVEDKASGPDAMADLVDAIPGLIPFNPGGESKYRRAEVGSAPLYAAGQKILPDTSIAPWVTDFERAHTAFRGLDGDEDDDIDAESQLDLYWQRQARQAPWLALPDALPAAAPAWLHPQGYGRHYVYTPGSLLTAPASWILAVVPPALTAPSVGHQGCAVVVSDQGDVVGHIVAPSMDAMANVALLLCKGLAEMTGSPRTLKLHQAAEWHRRIRVRVVHVGGRDRQAADRMEETLRQRSLGVTDTWTCTPGALSDAAQRGRALLEHGRLIVHDPKLRDLLRCATLHPDTGAVEVPRTVDRAPTYVGRPAAIDGVLLACAAAFDLVGSMREAAVQKSIRQDEIPKTYEEQMLDRLRASAVDVRRAKQASLFGALR